MEQSDSPVWNHFLKKYILAHTSEQDSTNCGEWAHRGNMWTYGTFNTGIGNEAMSGNATTLIKKSEATFPCPARKETPVFFEDVIRYVKTQENNCKYCSVLATSPGGSVLCDVKRFECVFMLPCKNIVVQTFPLCSPVEWSHCNFYL